MRIVLYTCITDGYDEPIPLHIDSKLVSENLLFTDMDADSVKGWERRPLVFQSDSSVPGLTNRYHKIFPHRLFKDCDLSIYVDGNIEVTKDFSPLIDQFFKSGKQIAVFKHSQRNNIVEETAACYSFGKFQQRDKELIPHQLESYAQEGFHLESQLLVGTVIFRKHNDLAKLDEAMEDWWRQLNVFTHRDQISLPYILWKNRMQPEIFDLDIFDNPFFKRVSHKRKKRSFAIKMVSGLRRIFHGV